MKSILAIFYCVTLFCGSSAFKYSTPYLPWVAVIDNVDVTKMDPEELKLLAQDCFEKCPVLVFKSQKEKACSAQQFLDLVSEFDPQVDQEAIADNQVLHPFRRDPDVPHVAIREGKKTKDDKELGDQFRFGPVWHMDLVGTNRFNLPNRVSAFHFLETPKKGGDTIFCNLEIAYASLPPDLRKQVDSLECIYDNDMESLFSTRYNDFERLGPFPESDELQVTRPLVHRDQTTGRKRLFFTPTRFNSFKGWTIEESWEFMTFLFYNYIQTPTNTAQIHWDEGDIAIFDNHRLIHTSTPWEIYKGQNRRFRLLFLNSKSMHDETQLV